MNLIELPSLTRSKIVDKYWIEFLEEVAVNKTVSRVTGATNWAIEPRELDFWKWIADNKLDELKVLSQTQTSPTLTVNERTSDEVAARQELTETLE